MTSGHFLIFSPLFSFPTPFLFLKKKTNIHQFTLYFIFFPERLHLLLTPCHTLECGGAASRTKRGNVLILAVDQNDLISLLLEVCALFWQAAQLKT